MPVTSSAELQALLRESEARNGVYGKGLETFGTSTSNNLFATTWRHAALGGGTWVAGAAPAAIPGGEVVNRNTVGAFPLPAPVGGKQRYLVRVQTQGDEALCAALADRLVQASGIVYNTGTPGAQTVNTVALPRYTTGENVWVAFETAGTLVAGTGTASVSYTNSAGVAGRTGSVSFSPPNGTEALFLMTLQAGDYGVRSVETVTVTTANGTAGATFNIVLFKFILIFNEGDPLTRQVNWTRDWRFTGLPVIEDEAALWYLTLGAETRSPTLLVDFGFGFS